MLKTISWNINGGSDPDWIRAVRQWLRNYKDVKAIGLQEIKAGEFRAEAGLRSIMRESNVVVDYAQNDKGGAAIIVSKELKLVDSGVKGDGSAAWVRVETEVGMIVLGDFNCVELPEDTQGASNLLNGRELRRWKEMMRASELVDAFFVAVKRRGSRFTRQRIRSDRVEFARLDRCYFTEGADWIEQVEELHHDGTAALSDHYPVIVNICLVSKVKVQDANWRSYFKFRVQDFGSQEVKQQVRLAWQAHPRRFGTRE
ncbi:hypothetical protein R1sor_008086 [Riccia sorocarpa]|uniref:Endonuclease/exonuclease/phosphatase domain-containing protein n=1 Tax=Riccia sorocarpa TaxID=122646 RepID=A0ABD3HVY6_9MARC